MNVKRKEQSLLAGAMALLAAGIVGISCTKGSPESVVRRGIRFVASMSTSGTRTSYSGEGERDTHDLLVRERIDWTDGDLIRVYSPQAAQSNGSTHYADYTVDSHETVGTPGAQLTSRATVVVAEGTSDLYWSGESEHTFYAVYPSPNTPGFTAGRTLEQDGMVFAPETVGEDEVMTFTGVIPVAQTVTRKNATENVWLPDMRPAYMLATASSTQAAATENGIKLQFIPKFSAFEFEVSAGEFPSVTLTEFSLTAASGILTGEFKIYDKDETTTADNFHTTIYGVDDANVTNGGQTITVDFGTGGITFSGTMQITVLALPQTVSGVTVSFTGTEIGTRSLELKKKDGTAISWAPYKKHRITGLSFPTLMTTTGEDILWDVEGWGENILWEAY